MTVLATPCPKCAFPRLLSRVGVYEYQYAGELVRVDVEFAVCHRCGAETTVPGQDARNAARITDANLEALASKWAVTRSLPPLRTDPAPGSRGGDDPEPRGERAEDDD